MRILFLGDVVGRSGREAVITTLPRLRRDLAIEFAVVNAENASHGFGLGPDMADALLAAGADAITLGNHAWDRREIIPYISTQKRLIRPINFPAGTPGEGFVDIMLTDGRRILVVNAMGRLFMDPLDCPFQAIEALLARVKLGVTHSAVLIDLHAEATSEKMAFAHMVDGRVSAVLGTHTHCPTADHQILPHGTAFMADVGMCGDYDSVIGMGKAGALARFVKKMPGDRLKPAEGDVTICGVFVETNPDGYALRIEPIRIGGRLAPIFPSV